LPMAKQGGGLKTAVLPIVVSILEDGRMVIGGEEVSEDSLKEKFEQVKAQNAQAMVIIQADRMVSHWRVVKTMDIAASVGLKHMAIATQEE
jgi:biopolymer transport protein ExbD